MCFLIKKKTDEKKKRTRGLWVGLLLLAASAGLAVWCILWGLPRLLPSAAAPSSSPLPDPPPGAEPDNRQGTKALAVDVPVVLQNPELPAGCEATAAAMLLAAYGYDTDKLSFAAALPKCSLELHDGLLYGPHPGETFIGSPDSSYGFGVFAPAVAKTMQAMIDKASGRHRALDVSGVGEDALLAYLDRGIPVCIWTTMELRPLANKGGWYLKDGDAYTNRYYTWPGNEHCVVLVAYDRYTVTVHDPLQGVVTWERALFFQRHAEVGAFAVVLEAT